jgi:hypothetical protein
MTNRIGGKSHFPFIRVRTRERNRYTVTVPGQNETIFVDTVKTINKNKDLPHKGGRQNLYCLSMSNEINYICKINSVFTLA